MPLQLTSEQLKSMVYEEPTSYTSEELKAERTAIDATREIMEHLGDRRRVLKAWRGATPEQREEILATAPGMGEFLRERRPGPLVRTAEAFVTRGMAQDIAQPIMELARFGGTEEEIAAIRQLEGIASQQYAPATPDDPWYERGPLLATEMVPWAVLAIRGGAAGKGVARKTGLASAMARTAGMGNVTLRAAEVAGITTATFPTLYAQELDSLREAGIGEGVWWREPAAALTATVNGTIESVVPNPFKVGKVPLNQGAMKAARSYLLEAVKQAPGELSEEFLQGLASGVGRAVATHLDENAPDQGLGSAFQESWNQGTEAALPLAFMLGVPAAGGAGVTAARVRLAELQQIRAKDWVTVEEGESLGLSEEEMLNRNTRKEAVDKRIKEAEKEVEDAEAVRSPEEEVREDEGGEDLRGAGEGQVPAEPEGEGAAAPEVPVEEEPPAPATDLESMTPEEVEREWRRVFPDAPKIAPGKTQMIREIRGETVPEPEAEPEEQPAEPEGPYEEFRDEYHRLLKKFMEYTPDQAGSHEYARRLGEFADRFPPEWVERAERELEEPEATVEPEPEPDPEASPEPESPYQVGDRVRDIRTGDIGVVEVVDRFGSGKVAIEYRRERDGVIDTRGLGDLEDATDASSQEPGQQAEPEPETTTAETEEVNIRAHMERNGVAAKDGVTAKVIPHRTRDGFYEVQITIAGDRQFAGEYEAISDAQEAAIGFLENPESIPEEAKPKPEEKKKRPLKSKKRVTAKGDQIDLSGLTDQELRHLSRYHKRRAYAGGHDIGGSVADEIQRRGIKDYQEGPPESKEAFEKYNNLRKFREDTQRNVTSAHTSLYSLEWTLTIEEAHNKRGVPLGGRGEYGLSAAKKWKSLIAAAKAAVPERAEYKKAKQAIEDAKAEVEKAKAEELKAERAYNRAAAEGFPKIPKGQVRYPIEGRQSVKVGEYDPERGQYEVESPSHTHWVSPQPLLDNYVSKEERDALNRIEEQYREAKGEIEKKKAEAARKKAEMADKDKLRNARKKVRQLQDTRYWKESRKRAQKRKGKKGKVEIAKDDENREERVATILSDKWAITEGKEEGGGKVYSLTHIPTGRSAVGYDKPLDVKHFMQFAEEIGMDWGAIPDDGNVSSEDQRRLRRAMVAFDAESFTDLTQEEQDILRGGVEVADPGITADMILDAYDLGKHGGETLGLKKQGVKIIEQLTKDVPEFAYDPVFVVDNEKKLIFRDHYTFKFEPGLFNLHPTEVEPGQTVGINLPDLGLKLETDQARVIAKTLKNAGYQVSVGRGKKASGTVKVKADGYTFEAFRERARGWVVHGIKNAEVALETKLHNLVGRIRWNHHSTKEALAVAGKEAASDFGETTPAKKKATPKADEGSGIAKMANPTRQSRTARRKAKDEEVGIAAADIVKTAERLFGVAIREGGFSNKAAGIYKWITGSNTPPSPEVVRTGEHYYASLAVASHEIGHHIDEKTKAVKSMPPAVREEVKGLDYQPEKARPSEGWAEFLRRYMTEPPIETIILADGGWVRQEVPNPGVDAPKTLAWFEGTFLPANPKIAKAITEFRGYAQQFAQQSVFQRVASLIADRKPQDLDFKQRWLNKSRRWLNRLKTSFVDKFHTLEWIQKEAKRRGHKGVGIYDLTMAHFLSASSHATVAFEEGVRSLQTGRPIGETTLWGLRDHLESDGEYTDAVLYALARHTAFMAETKPEYNTGMDVEDADAWIREVETTGKKDRFEAFARGLSQFNNDLIRMLVEAGALPVAEADRMMAYYEDQNYFPLHRVRDVENSQFAGTGARFVNLGRAVRRRSRTGSGRQVIDPIDATVAQAIRFYGRAIQARQQHVLSETLDPHRGGVGGMGGLMDRVDPRKKVTHGKIQEILKTLVDEGIIEADDAKAMRIAAKILHPYEGLPSAKSLQWFAERHGIEIPEAEEGEIEPELAEDVWVQLVDAAMQEPDALAVISLWRPDYTPNAAKRTVVIYSKSGDPLMYEMDPDLYATATGMNEMQFGPFMSVFRAAARYFKTGAVGASTGFGTANLFRDYWEFQGKARHTKGFDSLGKPPEMLGRYVAEKARKLAGHKANDPLIRLYEETGGKVYSVIGHDVHGRQRYRRRRIGKSTMSQLGVSMKRPMETAEGALQAVQDIIAISDAPPRLADAEAALKEEGYVVRDGKWFDLNADRYVVALPEHARIKAAIAMAEATINFKRIGSKGQYIESFMPFFNATVQAMYRQYRQVKGLRSLGKGNAEAMRAKRYLVYLSALVSAGVLHWLLRHDDDDWREQDAYLRDGYWTWGADGRTYVRIPKPRDTAVVSNVTENMLDAWYHEDARGMDDLIGRDVMNRLPTGGGLVRGAIETYVADYDYFRGRQLTPEYVKHLPKEQQVTPYTTRASDAIGAVTGRYFGTSPVQAEHLLNSASGGFYHRMADLYDASVDGRLGPEHVPFIRGLVINRHQARSVNEFYEEKEATRIAIHREKAAKGKVSDELVRKQAILDGYAELMTKIRDMEMRAGKRRGYEYQPYIVGLARNALGYKPLENNPNPLVDENAPDAIKGVVKDYSRRVVNQAAAPLKRQSEYKDDEAFEEARKSQLRGRARMELLGLSHDEAQRLLVESYRRTDSKGRRQTEMQAGARGKFDPSYLARALELAELYGESDPRDAVRRARGRIGTH